MIVDRYLSPTLVNFLASAIIYISENRKKLEKIHIASARASRYDLSLILTKILNMDKKRIVGTCLSRLKLMAQGPRNSSLSTELLFKEYGLVHPTHDSCLRKIISSVLGNNLEMKDVSKGEI